VAWCVTHSTCAVRERRAIFSPKPSAVAAAYAHVDLVKDQRLHGAHTSHHRFSANMIRDISPPEAIRASSSGPVRRGFGEIKNRSAIPGLEDAARSSAAGVGGRSGTLEAGVLHARSPSSATRRR